MVEIRKQRVESWSHEQHRQVLRAADNAERARSQPPGWAGRGCRAAVQHSGSAGRATSAWANQEALMPPLRELAKRAIGVRGSPPRSSITSRNPLAAAAEAPRARRGMGSPRARVQTERTRSTPRIEVSREYVALRQVADLAVALRAGQPRHADCAGSVHENEDRLEQSRLAAPWNPAPRRIAPGATRGRRRSRPAGGGGLPFWRSAPRALSRVCS